MQRIKVGLLGVGRLGSVHLEHLMQSTQFELIGCFDNNRDQLERISEDYAIPVFDNAEELMNLCEAIDIVTPAKTHYYYAEKAIRKSKHVFIEKPMTEDLSEAELILSLSREANVKVQIGHVERFNPVYIAAKEIAPEPMFMEAQRLSPFDPKTTQTSVVLDLMINDIDLVLDLVNANIKYISANGLAVISKEPDIANARIEFDNGAVANLTASRVSMQRIRKLQLFQKNTYMNLDFLKREAEHITLEQETGIGGIPLRLDGGVQYVQSRQLVIPEHDPIRAQLDSFAESISQNHEPKVTAQDGKKSLEVAYEIMGKIRRNGSF